jgi:WD40 repeat protein
VQHAHQKGIIHRDLKPSNILVTLHDGVPVPKVIDFGVAKAMGQSLTEKTVYTALSQLVGTPLYMSPEQAEMNQLGVDTRSDVYSLGVLLYELLTGTTPFDKEALGSSGLEEMRRMIREDEPPRPSARVSSLQPEALSTASQRRGTDPRRISAALHGELDWIVMKALEKDRGRRYESASALATDIQRYLDDEPVLAGPPSTMYKFHKFARKHRAALATAVAIAASLILGTTASAWQAVRATTAEAQANANEQKAVANAAAAQEKEQEAIKQRDEVKSLNDTLQRTLYAAHMNLAHNAFGAGGIGRAMELLEQHRPKAGQSDLRGFEWYYLYRLCHPELLTIKDAGDSAVFSPDGKRLAAGSKIWDAETGEELLVLQGGRRSSKAYSPDGKRLASTGEKEVKVWNAETGQELLTLKAQPQGVRSVAFSPDGKRLASTSIDRTVIMWDGQTGQELFTLKGHTKGYVSCVAFSPDGKRLASASSGTVLVWDVDTGQELLSFKGGFYDVAYSPDGKRLAGIADDGTVRVWDAQTGQELLTCQGTSRWLNTVAYSPDGKRLAGVGGDRTVRVWDAQTGQELISLKGHSDMIMSVVFSADGTRLATADGGNTIMVWDATSSPGSRTFSGHTDNVRTVVVSPDCKRMAGVSQDPTTKESAVKVWDAQTGQELLLLKKDDVSVPLRVAFSPDGKRLAIGGPGEVKVWDAQTGQELLSFKARARFVAFSPDGKRLASISALPGPQGPPFPVEIKMWDAQTGRELFTLATQVPRRGEGLESSVVFSPDGKRLASAGKVWDAQTGQELSTLQGHTGSVRELFTLQAHAGSVSSMAFSPDGKRLASISTLTLYDPNGPPVSVETKVWDAQTGRELLSLQAQNARFSALAFSRDGTRLATSSNVGVAGVGEVKVWDAQTGQELLSLKGHTATVSSVVFSPDGKRVASGSGSLGGGQLGELKLWDAQTGQELLTLNGGGSGHRVAFSPSGHLLASEAGGTVKIYDATPLPEKP